MRLDALRSVLLLSCLARRQGGAALCERASRTVLGGVLTGGGSARGRRAAAVGVGRGRALPRRVWAGAGVGERLEGGVLGGHAAVHSTAHRWPRRDAAHPRGHVRARHAAAGKASRTALMACQPCTVSCSQSRRRREQWPAQLQRSWRGRACLSPGAQSPSMRVASIAVDRKELGRHWGRGSSATSAAIGVIAAARSEQDAANVPCVAGPCAKQHTRRHQRGFPVIWHRRWTSGTAP
jgi:hypothetical protein